ncbi:MAG: apolipoprotein N-acyltransferase [Robiginitomaculum sp.]|nr:apolipoprotein N-acyltransferase [Robiginitomaculum sp.]
MRTPINRFVAATGWRGFALNIGLGATAVLGHAPFYLWPVTILCFALFMLRLDAARLRAKPLRRGFWCGFSFALGYFVAGLYWIGSAFVARGPEFIPLMPFAILGLCAGLALFWAIGGLAYVRLCGVKRTSLWSAGIFASVFFIVEFARGHIFSGFPWNLPGYIFAAGKPVSQTASIVGIYGLTALVFFLSAATALWIASPKKYVPLVLWLGVVALSFGYGSWRLSQADIKYVDGVKLRIVHANIPQRDKFDPNKYVQTVNTYLQLSRSAGFEDVTHIIWPEGAVPGLIFEDPILMAAIEQMALSGTSSGTGAPPVFVTQTLRVENRQDKPKPNYYNSAAAVSFKAGAPPQYTAYYDKQKLVPFGEFIPGRGLLEKLGFRSLSSALESMTPGSSGVMPHLPGLPAVSIQICYEIIFPGFTQKNRPENAQKPNWILNLSNDSWYGNSSGPRQHINQARYRAIEQGLPVIRATSGGISGAIDPYGRQLNQLGVGEQGVIDTLLPQPLTRTFYNYTTNYRMFLLIAFLLIGCKVGMHRAR